MDVLYELQAEHDICLGPSMSVLIWPLFSCTTSFQIVQIWGHLGGAIWALSLSNVART